VKECIQALTAKGFTPLKESEVWTGSLIAGGKYYFTRNLTTIVAFTVGGKYEPGNRFKIIGCHSDSPVARTSSIPH